MNRMNKLVLPISIVTLAAVLVVVFFVSSQNAKSSSDIIKPQIGDISNQLRFSGKIQPKDTFDLGFQVSGKVSKIYVAVGDKVQKGQLLAELNSEEANTAYAQTVADQAVAEAQLKQAQHDKDAQAAKLKSVKKSSSSNKYDKQYQREVEKSSADNINAKEASLEKNKEAMQNSQLQVDKTRLYAPANGIITKQSLAEGETEYYYTPVISLIGGSDALEIDAYVSEIEVAKISVGDKAQIKIDASQTENLEATISAIEPVETNVANVSSYKVSFMPNFANDKIKSGMIADITLDLGEKKNALIVPEQSIFEENGKYFVLVLNGNDHIKKEVQLGVRDQAGNVEIISGISAQDEIVSFNQSK